MKTETKIESNILIAEFMQPSFNGFGIYDYEGGFYKKEEMLFNSSWDWLMPVVSKITRDEFLIENEYRESIMDTIPYGLIEDSYKVVVEFIKWYNENQ